MYMLYNVIGEDIQYCTYVPCSLIIKKCWHSCRFPKHSSGDPDMINLYVILRLFILIYCLQMVQVAITIASLTWLGLLLLHNLLLLLLGRLLLLLDKVLLLEDDGAVLGLGHGRRQRRLGISFQR